MRSHGAVERREAIQEGCPAKSACPERLKPLRNDGVMETRKNPLGVGDLLLDGLVGGGGGAGDERVELAEHALAVLLLGLGGGRERPLNL